MSPAQIESWINTNLISPMNVTRVVLPFIHKARSGHIISIFGCVIRFLLEAVIEPGFFRTELMEPESTTWPELFIDNYAEPTAKPRNLNR
ncbi:hypothetical protein MKX34_28815 [Paenibacillus sp. FSL R5-0636]|uniref:hypothetical protein n=1 Tax=Paenibacillus sp. FSL R5-0636 TaxID=2921652 RepID=UPI0030D11499